MQPGIFRSVHCLWNGLFSTPLGVNQQCRLALTHAGAIYFTRENDMTQTKKHLKNGSADESRSQQGTNIGLARFESVLKALFSTPDA